MTRAPERAAPECAEIERTHALADGELSGAAADAARDHLATCASCQGELADLLQLDAAVAARRSAVISLAWYRQRRLQVAAVAAAAAAAVAVFLALPRPGAPVTPTVAVALAPHRATEARLAWPGAAAHRSYDVPRAGEPPHESVPLVALAELERKGDVHGVGVLALLNGDRRQAASYLERAGDSPDTLADRAALALAEAQPERALTLADAALARQASHGAALWNRALALRDLGLSRTAAEAFRAVAGLGEPGWAEEATQRAATVDREVRAVQERYERINRASAELAQGKLTLSVDDAAAQPGFARGVLYDAIRSATTPAQLAALQPLADAIDGADHDTAMKDALARAGANLHPQLSKQYAEMIRSLAVEMQIIPRAGDEQPVPAGEPRTRFLAALRAAHADDLRIGVLMKTNDDRWTVNPKDIAEFARLTAASPDPWMQILGLQHQAQLAINQEDLTRAEAILLQAKQRCTPTAPAFRCITISKLLGDLYIRWQRLPEARAVLSAAWTRSRQAGEWVLQNWLLSQLAQLASLGDEIGASGLPLVSAYIDELVRGYPEGATDYRCLTEAWGHDLRAMLLINQLRFEDARRELTGPACAKPQEALQEVNHLFARSELARFGDGPDQVAALRFEIARARKLPDAAPADQVMLDHAEGRLLIDRDPAAGDALLRSAIRTAEAMPTVTRARKAAGWSYSVLVAAAAHRGDGRAALELLAKEQGVTAAERCVLGVAIEDQQRTFVARGVDSKTIVHHDEARKTVALDPTTLVPAEISTALSRCDVVDVIARPPIQGMSRLLGDALAWRYVSRRGRPVTPQSGPSLVVGNVQPPAALELPRLPTWSTSGEMLSGASATPSRVLAAISGAGEVTIHAHGLVDVALPDASFLALSPEPDGRFALTTADVRKARFTASPLIVLAACRASSAAPIWHETWSLPAAFVLAGARAVIASAAPIPDAEAGQFFDAVRGKVRADISVAVALRDARQQWLGNHRADWVRDVIVFE
ncbi:MAG TPA: CHAT domain-containing protein [Kofleriaceae bacterium]